MTKDIILVALNHALFICIQGFISYRIVQTKLLPVQPKWQWRKLTKLIFSSLPMAISAPLSQLFLQGPILLLKKVDAPLSMLGNLSLSMQAFMIVNSLFSSISLSAIPVLSRAKKGNNVTKFAQLSVKFAVIMGFNFYLIGCIIIEPFLLWVFESGYENATTHTSSRSML